MKRAHGRAVTHLLLWLAVVAFGAFVAWANWATLDQITRAPGQVITSSRNQVIQAPPNGGVIEMLNVREGAAVTRGQVLVRFERAKIRATYEEAATRAAALKATLARLDAEIAGRDPAFPKELDGYRQFRDNQLALFHKRRQLLNEDIKTLEQMRELSQQELDMNLPLVKSGDVSRAEVLKLQRQVADLSGQIVSKRNKFFQDIQTDLAKAREDLSGVEQIMVQRKEELDLTEIRAPMDGIVRNVRFTTLGGVARPGDELMQIVPVEDKLVIEAKVRTADVGFLRLKLPATVKLDAYDYSIYGTLLGHVSYVSADTLTEQVSGQEVPYYRVHVTIDRSDLRPRQGEKIDIQPGMTSTVEIRTGEKTVWDYVTKPITKTLDESLRER
jgi:adhesin transport system membrane fusion protein